MVNEPLHRVLHNEDGQYSLWPLRKTAPVGWQDAGIAGTRAECMGRVREVWTDLRPRRLRD
jgi:MbtH protein